MGCCYQAGRVGAVGAALGCWAAFVVGQVKCTHTHTQRHSLWETGNDDGAIKEPFFFFESEGQRSLPSAAG